MPLNLTFSGSGNAFAPERCWSGFLLNGRYAFDMPPTTLVNFKKLGIDLAAIDTILLSHFHADHFYGLPFLLLEYTYLTRRHSDLTIIGPAGTEERVRLLLSIGYPGLLKQDAGYLCHYIEVADGAAGAVNGLQYRAVRVEHGGEEMESFGYQVNVDGRRLSYTGDTGWCEGLLTLAADAEVMVTDCTYADGRNHPDQHLSFDDIRELRGRIDPGTNLILTHLGGQRVTGGLERVHVAADLATFAFF